jgi:flagellar motor protein MotB
MAKKQKPIDAGPSKAYLVSFGDTMTALLAFFIVLNSLATEQTGANMYAGTGSFVNAFSKSGMAGGMPGNRSRDMIQQNHQSPIYALPENIDKNPGKDKKGPDDTDRQDRVINREKESFQKFLKKIEEKFGVEEKKPIADQVVLDSFERLGRGERFLSEHAVNLASELIPKLRQPESQLEIILWTPMPSRSEIERQLEKSYKVRAEIESMFWLKPDMEDRLRYTVKPWLFSDARRPVMSFVMSKTRQ